MVHEGSALGFGRAPCARRATKGAVMLVRFEGMMLVIMRMGARDSEYEGIAERPALPRSRKRRLFDRTRDAIPEPLVGGLRDARP